MMLFCWHSGARLEKSDFYIRIVQTGGFAGEEDKCARSKVIPVSDPAGRYLAVRLNDPETSVLREKIMLVLSNMLGMRNTDIKQSWGDNAFDSVGGDMGFTFQVFDSNGRKVKDLSVKPGGKRYGYFQDLCEEIYQNARSRSEVRLPSSIGGLNPGL